MRCFALACAAFACATLFACSNGGSGGTNATESATPATSPTIGAEATATESTSATVAESAASAAPTPTSTPTSDPNLLAESNGTIVRAFSPDINDAAGAGDVNQGGWEFANNNPPAPYDFTFELPGVAHVTQFTIHPNDIPDEGATVTISVSTTGMQDAAFSNVGSVTLKPNETDPTTLAANVNARWVKMTIQASGGHQGVAYLEAFGALAPRPNAPVSGFYYVLPTPYPPGATQFDSSVTSDSAPVVVSQSGTSMNAQVCGGSPGSNEPSAGSFDGRVYTVLGDYARRWVANDEGTMFVGTGNVGSIYLLRTNATPASCKPIRVGSGKHTIVAIDSPQQAYFWPLDTGTSIPQYSFTRMMPALLGSASLASTDTVIWNMLCDPGGFLDAAQIKMLLSWIAAGHKLIIHDGDLCAGTTATDYSFLPYPFTTDNPGPHGARGTTFVLLENDTLGSNDRSDAEHFIDAQGYLSDGEIGDANIVTTKDPHWCGHFFGSNVDNVNGFMQMYARYGRGLIIYDGLDHDDNGSPEYQRIIKLELDQPVSGDLPCTRTAAASLVLIPDRTLKFKAGVTQTLQTTLQLYANQSWHGHVTMSASGELHANVMPSSFDLSGNQKALKVAIHISSSTRPGSYSILVGAQAPGTLPAEATITVGAASSIASELATQRRVRLYGIHFDYDSARIQPQSEPVIAQIAAAMRANSALRFRVEGYTDSDGGFAYNMGLSQRRAQSVVDDLVARYGIARSRLTPQGFGMQNPVASNATDAGKALNRRVELVRI
jgi:outer membrane protein OmpA-like peptidoglycan-associated protein